MRYQLKPTFGGVEIQRVHGVIDHPIAELPVLEHLCLRVRLTRDAVALAAVLFPQPKRSFVTLKIQVCKEESVIRNLPERILVVGAQPLLRRAALDGFAEHRQRRVILAFQHSSKHRMRMVHRLDCTSRQPTQSISTASKLTGVVSRTATRHRLRKSFVHHRSLWSRLGRLLITGSARCEPRPQEAVVSIFSAAWSACGHYFFRATSTLDG